MKHHVLTPPITKHVQNRIFIPQDNSASYQRKPFLSYRKRLLSSHPPSLSLLLSILPSLGPPSSSVPSSYRCTFVRSSISNSSSSSLQISCITGENIDFGGSLPGSSVLQRLRREYAIGLGGEDGSLFKRCLPGGRRFSCYGG